MAACCKHAFHSSWHGTMFAPFDDGLESSSWSGCDILCSRVASTAHLLLIFTIPHIHRKQRRRRPLIPQLTQNWSALTDRHLKGRLGMQ